MIFLLFFLFFPHLCAADTHLYDHANRLQHSIQEWIKERDPSLDSTAYTLSIVDDATTYETESCFQKTMCTRCAKNLSFNHLTLAIRQNDTLFLTLCLSVTLSVDRTNTRFWYSALHPHPLHAELFGLMHGIQKDFLNLYNEDVHQNAHFILASQPFRERVLAFFASKFEKRAME